MLLVADVLKVGESVSPAFIKDQFNNPHIVSNEHYWVVTWDKKTTRRANTYFELHRDLLEDKSAALIVDVSQTPPGIMELFVVPRMKSYEHPILLSSDETYNARIPYMEDHITVLCLSEKTITKIFFPKDAKKLAIVLEKGCREEPKP